jgi:hypothetical protein
MTGLDEHSIGDRFSTRLDRLTAARREGAAGRQVGEVRR